MDNVMIADTTLMFAKAYGIYFLVVGLALLACPSRFRTWYEDILSEVDVFYLVEQFLY